MGRTKGSKNKPKAEKPKQEWKVVEETPIEPVSDGNGETPTEHHSRVVYSDVATSGFMQVLEPPPTVSKISEAMEAVRSATDPFWDVLPAAGAFLLFQAMTFKQGLGALRFFNVFRSITDEKGGVWTCGECDEGIRITYDENQFAAQEAKNRIGRLEPELSTAMHTLKVVRSMERADEIPHWEDKIETLQAQIEELLPISNSKVVHVKVFPFEGRGKVV